MTAPTADPARVAAARRRLLAQGVEILGEDHLVLGISKAAGVLSQPGPAGELSLVELVDAYRREAEGKAGHAFVGLVHRLDRNVSGAMVVAKTSKAASRLSEAFRTRVGVEKTYLAWTAGSPAKDRDTLRSVLVRDLLRRVTTARPAPQPAADDAAGTDGEDAADGEASVATLDYVVEARGPRGCRLRVRLHTGQTHQIRAQLAREGLPLLGDVKYGGPAGPRPALHARRLVVPHPVTRAPVIVDAPVPDDLRRLDRDLGLRPAAD